ncbi:hypothetical protein SAMN04488032_1156 [Pacificibacter marinus]|uniref:Uncharacterized protein n=1 Tax=Pacificibacter marinus TaxID=658057 RepID=A0A1Y5TMT2_9RHOB|nr:hypothetical protein SAMN04488032_1156 [Pacificibacter marinus]SLN65640.1 hypothetical protein PAM7971_03458 [Pacificibacter marinus]
MPCVDPLSISQLTSKPAETSSPKSERSGANLEKSFQVNRVSLQDVSRTRFADLLRVAFPASTDTCLCKVWSCVMFDIAFRALNFPPFTCPKIATQRAVRLVKCRKELSHAVH